MNQTHPEFDSDSDEIQLDSAQIQPVQIDPIIDPTIDPIIDPIIDTIIHPRIDPTIDPIKVAVWHQLLASVAEEMGTTLERTAYSPNIKERLDHSCAIFDRYGRLLAQAAHIPVHLGAMPLMLKELLRRQQVTWRPGYMWICNDPRVGGTHLPDITLVAPVFSSNGTDILGYVASRAHHADIGGMAPGSLPLSSEAFQEGLVIPPMLLMEDESVRADLVELICANSRTPQERRGDLTAQIAANQTGVRRFREIINAHSFAEFERSTQQSIEYAQQSVKAALAAIPPGIYTASDYLEDDGQGAQHIPIRVTIVVQDPGAILFDFTGSSPQVKGSLNATAAITHSACYYVVRCLIDGEIPTNEGCFLPIRVIAPEASIVNATFPAAVAGGNVETSQRITDVLLRALAQAIPEEIPAGSQGTMNNVTIGGFDPVRNRPFAYYETIAGGSGASPQGDGASAIHSHMTNTRNTPIEALETHYPLRMLEYSVAPGTGGKGEHRGGDGIMRRIEFLADAQITLLTERRLLRPFGVNGGEDGEVGKNLFFSTESSPQNANSNHQQDGSNQSVPSKWRCLAQPGDVLTIQTPGGGGWGEPPSRVRDENSEPTA